MRFRTARTAAATSDDAEIARLRARYLDLLKGALTHTLYRPMDVRFENSGYVLDEAEMRESVEKEFSKEDFDWADVRADGRDWPRFAQSMVGLKRLDNVQRCVEQVLADGVPGDLIETGVWRGGAVILMRAVLEAYGDHDRAVYAADSFAGLPAPDEAKYPADAGSRLHSAEPLAVPRSEVERNFRLYGLLDGQVRFLEGWFKDTLAHGRRPDVVGRAPRRRHVRVDDGRARQPLPAPLGRRLPHRRRLRLRAVPAGRRRLPRRERRSPNRSSRSTGSARTGGGASEACARGTDGGRARRSRMLEL